MRRDPDSGTTADPGAADRLLRSGEVGSCKHEAGTAALGQSGQRNFGIAAAQLFPGEEYELGAIRTGWYRDRTIGLSLDLTVDQACEMRGVLCGLRRNDQCLLEAF